MVDSEFAAGVGSGRIRPEEVMMNKFARLRWRQFSLRSLLILMLVIASYFAGRMAPQRELERAQAEAAQARSAEERALQAETQARLEKAMVLEQKRLAELQAKYPRRHARLESLREESRAAEDKP
jgi:hypothetical protein